MCGRLAPGGLLVEGTCDELGRRACWVALDQSGPLTITLRRPRRRPGPAQ